LSDVQTLFKTSNVVTLSDVLAAGNTATANIVLTGDITASGVITGATVTSTGTVNAVTVTASGVVTGATVTSTGTVNAVTVIASGAVSGSSVRTPSLSAAPGDYLSIDSLPTYADNTAAKLPAGVLSAGDIYVTSGAGAAPLNVAGILMIVV